MNNAKDLIPPPSKTDIMSKLSRHFNDDIRNAIIIRNVKTHEKLIKLLDAFVQAGPSNLNPSNTNSNSFQNQRSYPSVYGKTAFSNGNNLKRNNYQMYNNRNNFEATANRAQQNVNCNYNLGTGFNGQDYKENSYSDYSNTIRFKGHNFIPLGHLDANQERDYNKRNFKGRNDNQRSNHHRFVQYGVYYRRENANIQDRGATKSWRSQGGETGAQRESIESEPNVIRHVRIITDVPSTMNRRPTTTKIH